MYNGLRVIPAWAWLRTVHSSRWFEGLRPPAQQLQWLCSPLARPGWPSQTSVTRAVRHPLSCRVQTSQHPGPGQIRIPSEDTSVPDSHPVPVIQNSFIMKVRLFLRISWFHVHLVLRRNIDFCFWVWTEHDARVSPPKYTLSAAWRQWCRNKVIFIHTS